MKKKGFLEALQENLKKPIVLLGIGIGLGTGQFFYQIIMKNSQNQTIESYIQDSQQSQEISDLKNQLAQIQQNCDKK